MQQEVRCPEGKAQALFLQEEFLMCPSSFPWWALPLGGIVGFLSATLTFKRFGIKGLLYLMPLVMVGALWAYVTLQHVSAAGC